MPPIKIEEESPVPLADINTRPKVFGIYGISGCGKTYLLDQLRAVLGTQKFAFFDSSAVIANIVPGGLAAFRRMANDEKKNVREGAIISIRDECDRTGKIGVVASHVMAWDDANPEADGECIWTDADARTYTRMIYLSTPPEVVHTRRREDRTRNRAQVSVSNISKWQARELARLLNLSVDNNISCSTANKSNPLSQALRILDPVEIDEEVRESPGAQHRLDHLVENWGNVVAKKVEALLVLDADRTLAPVDTDELFWKKFNDSRRQNAGQTPKEWDPDKDSPLKVLFSQLGQTPEAFQRATLLYERETDEGLFEHLCDEVASEVHMYPEFVNILKDDIQYEPNVGAVIVTCGIQRIWEKVLEKEEIFGAIGVIGNGRLENGYLIHARGKAQLVSRLQDAHKMYVCAIGDSPLDLPMMERANMAIVAVGEVHGRSESMEDKLREAIVSRRLKAGKLLLPSTAEPRLDNSLLPNYTLPEIFEKMFHEMNPPSPAPEWKRRVQGGTESQAAKLLMTPTRNANISGPALRKAYERIGAYLATQFLSEIIGTEEYDIAYVQGGLTKGYRLGEERTLIVALMRSGEPLAQGVNEVMPSAAFLHAKSASDVTDEYTQGRDTIILADGVVNSGSTVMEFVNHIRPKMPNTRIIIAVGVTQEDAINEGAFSEMLQKDNNLWLVTLRFSKNTDTGKGGTDTGHRLFNTTFESRMGVSNLKVEVEMEDREG